MFARKPPIVLMLMQGRGGIKAVLRHLSKMTFSPSYSPHVRDSVVDVV